MEEITKEEVVQVPEQKITKEQIDLIFRGERPEGMDFELFKKHRKALGNFIHKASKGRFIFISSDIQVDEKGIAKRVTKTYRKDEIKLAE